MNTENLITLRALRNEEKNIKARIAEVSKAAEEEAKAILAEQGKTQGEFTLPNGFKYQLQRTEVFDMANYNRYKGDDAKRWRELATQKDFAKKTAAADTKAMDAITKAFAIAHPLWEPDDTKFTVKVI